MSTLIAPRVPSQMRTRTWVILALIAGLVALAWRQFRPLPVQLPIIKTLPTWRLTNEQGQGFGSEDLRGKVYLANFVFSRCPSVCPKMLRETSQLQTALASYGDKVMLTTFTVDPDFDTPSVLGQVAKEYGAHSNLWTFLTSTDRPALAKLYREGFMVSAGPVDPSAGLYDVAHTEKIVLVDGEARIRGYYRYGAEGQSQLIKDVASLVIHD